ncbi:MAG: hypothetical protein M0Q90_15660 [Bacteroidales bacterium]|nr:hypothetical protein [Bacteroidales bacterium]
MKKLHFVILLPLLVGLLFSCQKEQEPISSKIDQAQLEKSQQIIRQIEGFDTKLNSNLKSGETITVDSLVWYTEALENYNNARPDLQYENFAVSKTTYTATLDNGSLSMQDASALFSTMQADLNTELANLSPTDDKLKLTDIALDSIEGNTAYLSANRVFGLKISVLYDAFDEDDDWIWGTVGQGDGTPPAGKCDGTMFGVSDGSDELQRRLNNPNFAFDQRYIFVGLVPVYEINGVAWPGLFIINDDQPDFSWDYCLTNEALTEQLAHAHTILYSYENQGGVRPSGKHLSSVIIIDDLLTWNYTSHLLHNYHATYGTLVPAPPIDD